jgi:regulator of protease activity HflC (stomatin/prohibitin superfamily)
LLTALTIFGRASAHADKMTKVSLRTVVMGIPAQGAITRDNVTSTVDAWPAGSRP